MNLKSLMGLRDTGIIYRSAIHKRGNILYLIIWNSDDELQLYSYDLTLKTMTELLNTTHVFTAGATTYKMSLIAMSDSIFFFCDGVLSTWKIDLTGPTISIITATHSRIVYINDTRFIGHLGPAGSTQVFIHNNLGTLIQTMPDITALMLDSAPIIETNNWYLASTGGVYKIVANGLSHTASLIPSGGFIYAIFKRQALYYAISNAQGIQYGLGLYTFDPTGILPMTYITNFFIAKVENIQSDFDGDNFYAVLSQSGYGFGERFGISIAKDVLTLEDISIDVLPGTIESNATVKVMGNRIFIDSATSAGASNNIALSELLNVKTTKTTISWLWIILLAGAGWYLINKN